MIPISYFSVTINAMSLPTPGTGFLDNTRPDHYGSDTVSPIPDTLDHAMDKGRAYLRWDFMVKELSTTISPIVFSNINKPGATPSAPPTSISFTLGYDRIDYLTTPDELNPGVILSNENAIKRFIARALMSTINRNSVIVDPTNIWGIPQPAPSGEKIVNIQVGPIANTITAAEGNITVLPIPNI